LLEEISLSCSIADFSLLTRTCKALYAFFLPRIYHTINWCWEDGQPSPPYHLLLRTLLSNTQLAEAVKVLRFRGGGVVRIHEWQDSGCEASYDHWKSARSIYVDGQRAKSAFSSKEHCMAVQLIENMAASGPLEWKTEFDRGNVDLFVALIVYRTQTIEQLDLGFGFLHHATFLPRFFRQLNHACKASDIYPQLTSVKLGLDGPRTPHGVYAHLDLFRLFFHLPHLTTIDTILMEPIVFAWPSPKILPRPELLTTLRLQKCTASEDTLGKILSCTPSLNHLTYDYYRMVACGPPHWECYDAIYHDDDSTRPTILIHAPRLSRALASVKNTLEELVVKIHFEATMYDSITHDCDAQFLCGIIGRLKCLEQMSRLRHLEIPWALLLGWDPDLRGSNGPGDIDSAAGFSPIVWADVLPPAIRCLRLRDDLSDFAYYPHRTIFPFDLVKRLLQDRRISLNSLDRLDFLFIWNHLYDRYVGPKVLEQELMGMCRVEEVECGVFRQLGWREELTEVKVKRSIGVENDDVYAG
jgi:hypothetical protein